MSRCQCLGLGRIAVVARGVQEINKVSEDKAKRRGSGASWAVVARSAPGRLVT